MLFFSFLNPFYYFIVQTEQILQNNKL